MPGKSTTLVIRILADATQAAQTMRGAAGNAGKFGSALNKATLPALGVVAGLGAMGKAAAEDAQGQALLAQSLRKSAGATDNQIASMEAWVGKTTLATGVADDKLRPALATIARATGDVSTAQSAMSTVLDTSAATGKDTQTVADAVAKAYAGNTGALKKLVPGLDKAVLKSGNMKDIMAELASKTGGAAAASADTAAGKFQKAQVAFSETKESIGAGLLPVIEKVTGMLAKFGGWAANNTGTVTKFAIALGILAGAVLIVNAAVKVISAATRVWAAIQAVMNVVMAANPIVLIILAIVALVVIMVIAYKKSATFRAIVQGAFRGIQIAGVAVKNALVAAWRAVSAALAAAARFIKTWVIDPIIAYFKMIWNAAKTMARLAGAAWSGLKSAFKAVYDWLKLHVIDPLVGLFNKVVDTVKTVIDWIKKIKIPAPVQWLIDKGKTLFGAAPAAAVALAPAPTVGARSGSRATVGATATAPAGEVLEPQVIVQVSDRKMAELVDVRLRRTSTSVARTLTRRKVVTV